MATISTGEVSKHLGFLVTRAYIEGLGVLPVEFVKGHPRWRKVDLPLICNAIARHMGLLASGLKVTPSAVDDNDEL